MCYTFCYTYISDTESSFLFKGFKCVIGFESPMSHDFEDTIVMMVSFFVVEISHKIRLFWDFVFL